MAKVMVSLPEDLLREVDAEAERRGMTRSGFLRELAEQEFQRRRAYRRARMAELNREATRGHGGNVAEVLKRSRPKWPK
jgi:metal-responsive CopG/Arc/MetJ family transcriptional regulator